MASYFDELGVDKEESQASHFDNSVLGSFMDVSENRDLNQSNQHETAHYYNAASFFNQLRNNILLRSNSQVDLSDDLLASMLSELEDNQSQGKTYSTDKNFIKNLPRFEASLFKEGDSCVICSEPYTRENHDDNNKVLRLPCKHNFDLECILPWLEINNTCPVCRGELPSDNPEWIKKQKEKEKRQYRQEQDDLLYG